MKLVPLKNIILSRDGLEVLKKILLSSPNCKFNPIIISTKKNVNLENLNQLVSSGAALSLYSYALRTKKCSLNEADVIFCFSSRNHLNNVLCHVQINKKKLKEIGFNLSSKTKWKYCLAHLLLPVKITSSNKNKLSALYSGRILFKNIFSGGKYNKNDLVLIHFGKVIQKVKKRTYLKILEEQLPLVENLNLNKNASKRIIDFEKNFGINLWQYNLSNYQKYHL